MVLGDASLKLLHDTQEKPSTLQFRKPSINVGHWRSLKPILRFIIRTYKKVGFGRVVVSSDPKP